MARDSERAEAVRAVMDLFDLVVESSVEGVRKPNPRIYEITCERLSVEPQRAVFLDDLGINLKPARELGMKTIKVTSEAQAIEDLAGITGLSFP
jgi:putative hydrolase of the HAD superfamily